MKKHNWFELSINILIAGFVGIFSTLLAGNIKAVYNTLEKPPLSASSFILLIVWAVLYVIMAVSITLYLKNRKEDENTKVVSIIYAIQLVLNFFYTIVFFRYQNFMLSLIIIIILVLLVFVLYIFFKAKNKDIGYIFLPYLLWLLYLIYLTIGITALN